jgi:hypothetical protein
MSRDNDKPTSPDDILFCGKEVQSIKNLIKLYASSGISQEAQKYRDMLPEEEKNVP